MTECVASTPAIRADIMGLVGQYHQLAIPLVTFQPGRTVIPPACQVVDEREMQALVGVALGGWFAGGRHTKAFEKKFGRLFGYENAVLVNSGSSANLLALAALTSPTLGDRRLRPGDEVLTTAAGFPTTLAPIVQHGLIPVFVDIDLPTYNVNVEQLREAVGPRTRAIMLAHLLGNPFDVDAVRAVAKEHDLWLIEDCADALGSRYDGSLVGTFGDLATFSFYGAHHLSMGEGGAVVAKTPQLRRLVECFRDWGRDCRCPPGCDNTCGNRFGQQFGSLPVGYDHKYVYSHIGFNLKATDMQAALGVVQLDKLAQFTAARCRNFTALRDGLADLTDVFLLAEPTPRSEPSWFGFALSVRPAAPFSRHDLVRYLDKRNIGTRQLFGGNLQRQPAFQNIESRQAGSLPNADFVTTNTFWIGVHPGLTPETIAYMLESIHAFCEERDS